MNEKQSSRDTPYKYREDTEPTGQLPHINSRNNNTDVDVPGAEQNVVTTNDAGIGDSAVNDDKLTKFTQNHSSDA